MKFTRNAHNEPKYKHSKIILIQKYYHVNFDIEQKRPLLLARSVHLMIIYMIMIIHQCPNNMCNYI